VESEAVITAAALARRFEGLYLKPYLCPAMVPTIGYGTTRYPNGLRVSLSDPPVTPEQAEAYLQWELRKCMQAVLRLCAMLQAWGPDAVAAIIDFTFNLGEGRLAASTLRRRIMEDDMEGAKVELMKWVIGGGRKLRGLELRRAAECALIG
jgi:lysozyme